MRLICGFHSAVQFHENTDTEIHVTATARYMANELIRSSEIYLPRSNRDRDYFFQQNKKRYNSKIIKLGIR